MKSNQDEVVQEADKVTLKARKIGTTLRKTSPNLPRVDGVILLTRDASHYKNFSLTPVRGVNLYTLNDWKSAVNEGSPTVLHGSDISLLDQTLEPKSIMAIDGSIRRLAGYNNLEIQSKKEERFHRIYKGTHSVRQDRVILHVYDLSSTNESKAEHLARREFETLHHLQRYSWAPRILDSFQMVLGYSGEMFFIPSWIRKLLLSMSELKKTRNGIHPIESNLPETPFGH